MDQNRTVSIRKLFLPAFLFVIFALCRPPEGSTQPTSSVTIDDVVVDDVGVHVYVSNDKTSATDATIFADAFNGTFWGRRTAVVRIPALCNNLKLDVIPVRFPPGGYDLRIQISLPGQGIVDSFHISHKSDLSHYPNSLFSGSHPKHGIAMDPVNTLTGELILAEKPDLFLDGPIPLIFQRYSASNSLPHESSPPALGVHWRHNFDVAAFRVDDTVRIVLASGRPVDFVLDGAVWRRISRHEHDVQLVSLGDALLYGDPTDPYLYYFDPGGLLSAIEDAAGNRLTLSYTGRFLDRVEDGLGRVLHFTYDTIGRLALVSDGTREVAFETMTFSKNIGENLRRLTDPLGGKTTYFNATVPDVHRQLLLSRYTPRGNRPWTQAYDSLGRVTKQTDALGNEHQFNYLDDPALTLIINPDGDTVLHEHDSRIDSGSEPRKLIEVRDQEGESTRFGYDEGRLTSVVNRMRDSVAFEHDERGLLSAYQDPEGYRSSYLYDVYSKHGIHRPLLSAEKLPDGSERTWENDANGNPVAFVDRAGNRFAYEYNERGLLLLPFSVLGGFRGMRAISIQHSRLSTPR